MKKILLSLALLLTSVGVWAQRLQPVSHSQWTVTAPNETPQQSNGTEGGTAYIKDNLTTTFYHSDWKSNYENGTSGNNKGQDGTQAFMIELAEEYSDIIQVTYAGRSDNRTSGWARKVRIYVLSALPEAWPVEDGNKKAFGSFTYAEKEALLARPDDVNSGPLGTPAFDNFTQGVWPNNNSGIRTAEFATPQAGRYVLFVMDEGTDTWLTCSDFQIYQSVNPVTDKGNPIEADTPYYLKVANREGDYYLDVTDGEEDTAESHVKTITMTQTPQPVYFTFIDGVWHISARPEHVTAFVGVDQRCAVPNCKAPVDWRIEPAGDNTWYLAQDTYNGDADNHHMGYDPDGAHANRVYTDKTKTSGVLKFSFIDLDSEAVVKVKAKFAKEKATKALECHGVGYPVEHSTVRQELQALIDAEDATEESINDAITAFFSPDAEIVLPEAGKVYRIYNGLATFGTRKSLFCNGTQLYYGEYSTTAQDQMWTFFSFETEPHPDAPWTAFKMMNLYTGKTPYPTGFNTHIRVGYAINDRCSWNFVGSGQFRLYANRLVNTNGDPDGQSLYAAAVNGGNATGGLVKPYNAGTQPGDEGVWYMEEVPVTRDMLRKQIDNIQNNYASHVLVKPEVRQQLAEAIAAAEEVYDNEEAGDEAYAAAFSDFVLAVNSCGPDFVDEAYVYMRTEGNENNISKYAYNDGNTLRGKENKDLRSLFRLTKSTMNGTWNIQTGNGRYARTIAKASAAVQTGTIPTEYNIYRYSNGNYTLRPEAATGDQQYWHNDDKENLVGWGITNVNSRWVFEVLTDEEVAQIYTVTINSPQATTVTLKDETYTGNRTVAVSGGFFVLDNPPAESDFSYANLDTDKYTHEFLVDGNGITLDVGYRYRGSDYCVLRCRSGNVYARYHSGNTLNGENMLTYQAQCVKESLFFVEEGEGDFAGFYTIRPLVAPSRFVYNLGTANADSKVATRPAPVITVTDEEGEETEVDGPLTGEYYWKITRRDDGSCNITPYADGGTSGDAFGWNKRGTNGDYKCIGYWSDHNESSDNQWYVHTLEEEFPIPAEGQYDENDAYVGLYTYASATALNGAATIINDNNLAVLQNGVADYVQPKPGAFYRLRNSVSDKYLVANEESEVSAGIELAPTDAASSVFYMDEGSAMLSYKVGQYFDANGKTLAEVGTRHFGQFAVAYGGMAQNKATYNNNGSWAYGAGNVLDKGNGAPNAEGYDWWVETVTELPVVFNAAALGYATFNAPVAVQLPEGVKAYVGEIVDESTVKMWMLTDGVIPANTPAVLYNGDYAAQPTVLLPILDNVEHQADVEEKNSFTGTVASALMSENLNYYSLQRNVNDNKVGFYRKTSGIRHGFRAWLETAITSEARHFTIIFDGSDATGLKEALGIENADVEIYDLSGRRLDKPAKGVNIIGGKKVVVR